MCKDGDGIKMNKIKAAKYFKQEADLGNCVGMLRYGDMLFYGDGIEKNRIEASKYY